MKITRFIFLSSLVALSVILSASCSKKAPSAPDLPADTFTQTMIVTDTASPTETCTHTITETGTATATTTNTPILDIYEPDDSPADAKPITPDAAAQLHNFYNLNDLDYVTFNGVAGVNYLVRAVNTNGSNMPVALWEENGAAEHSTADGYLWTYMPVFCAVDTTYVIQASDASGTYGLNNDYNLDVITLPAVVPVDFNAAVDNAGLVFTFDGDGTWVGQSDYYHTGASSAQSPHLNNVQAAGFSTDVTGPCTVKFWWKISSESCCDKLSFSVDDAVTAYEETAGQHDWVQMIVSITGAGTHALKWQYSKDTSIACGYDTAWVDGIEVIP